jgi:nitroreductase
VTRTNERITEYPVADVFPNRWSPRAMSGEVIGDSELMSLFEAARWAPSCFNAQPWRFLYAKRDTADWPLFLSFMKEMNQAWAHRAAALIVIVSRTTFEANGKPNLVASFDSGAAWGSLALQGALDGLVVHGMAGIDYERAKAELGVPDDHKVEAMAAIGKRGNAADLPEPLQEREKPSNRKPLSEIAIAGTFR